MGEGKKKKKFVDQRILEHSASWRTPFSSNSFGESKLAVLNRIGETRQQPKEPIREVNTQSTEVSRDFNFTWWKLAACLLAIVAIPFTLEFSGRMEVHNFSEVNQLTKLPDGSQVTLSPGSGIKYNRYIWPVNRRLDLVGAGYFEVDKGFPFRVSTEVGEVRVIGTSFSVWAKPHLLFVQCTQGEVEVSAGEKKVNIGKGQFATADGKTSISTSALVNIPILPEQSNLLSFEETPLCAVLAQLAFKSGLKIQSELNPDWKYSGILNSANIKESFELLCKPFGATYQISADGIVSIKL